ncbi:MAG: hypothetical protein LBB67_06760 [Oscillospiraceae bacterium]|nr:hypothetical protein [Oscillospiraceae bacterium]
MTKEKTERRLATVRREMQQIREHIEARLKNQLVQKYAVGENAAQRYDMELKELYQRLEKLEAEEDSLEEQLKNNSGRLRRYGIVPMEW